jgi:hypothetical protein
LLFDPGMLRRLSRGMASAWQAVLLGVDGMVAGEELARGGCRTTEGRAQERNSK